MGEQTRQQITWIIIIALVLSVVVVALHRRAEVDNLLTTIATGSPDARVGAVERLVEKQQLMEALEDQPRWVQDRAVSAAILVGTEQAMFQLIGAKSVVDAPVQVEIDDYLTSVGRTSIGPLVAAIQDKDAAIRGGASGPLKTIGEPAVYSLMQLVDVYDDAVRGLVASTLGGIGAPAIEPLLTVMRQEEPGPDQGPAAFRRSKSAAEAAFKAMGEIAMDPMIEELLPSDNPDIRLAATGILGAVAAGKAEEVASRAVSPLIERLTEDEAWAVRRRAASALAGLGDIAKDYGAVPHLIGRLNDPRVEVRAAAVTALGTLAVPEAAQPLADLLMTERVGVTAEIADALEKIGPPAIEPLTPALDHPETEVRLVAAETLATIGTSRAVMPLANALDDPEPKIRTVAADALRNLADERVLPQLAMALRDSESSVYYAARDALIRLGAPAVPTLVEALASDNPRVAYVAQQALARIGEPAIEPLLNRMRTGPGQAAHWAAIALGSIGEAAVDPAIQLLENTAAPAPVRAAAAEALGVTGSNSATDALARAATERGAQPPEVRRVAVKAMGEIGDERATDALVTALSDPASEVRHMALAVLRNWRRGEVDEKLQNLLQAADQTAARLAAIILARHSPAAGGELIRAIGATEGPQVGESDRVRDLLEGLVADASAPDDLRREAIEALEYVGTEDSLDALEPLLEAGNRFADSAARTVGRIGQRMAKTAAPVASGVEVEAGPAARMLLRVFDTAENRQLKLIAGSGLAIMGAQPVAPLLERMERADSEERAWIAAILGAIGKPATDLVLDARGKADDPVYRNWLAASLVLIGDARALDLIDQLPEEEQPDPERIQAARAIFGELQRLL